MKKSILTFFFAFIPGAGQMYQRYMKRGLSLITFFVLALMAGALVRPLYYTCAIVWMYSFFDTFDLREHLAAGSAKADDYIIHVDLYDAKMRRVLSESHRLLGWALIAIGALAVYENILMRLLDDIMWRNEDGGSALLRSIYLVCDQLPEVFVCVVLVICGVWLLRSPKGAKAFSPAACLPAEQSEQDGSSPVPAPDETPVAEEISEEAADEPDEEIAISSADDDDEDF